MTSFAGKPDLIGCFLDQTLRNIASLCLWPVAVLFFAHLFGSSVEPRYRPVHLPQLHIMAVDEPPGGFDGGRIIKTIQLNHANGSVV
jgi:hypothetical protein